MADSNLHRQLFDRAMELSQLEPWKRFDGRDIFRVRLSSAGCPYAISIMGASGVELGLAITAGPDAFAHMQAVASGEWSESELSQGHLLSCTFIRFGELPPDRRGFFNNAGFKRAGVSPTLDQRVPHFFVKPAWKQPREPNTAELRTLLGLIEIILTALKSRALEPGRTSTREGVLTLERSGNEDSHQVSSAFEPADAVLREESGAQLILNHRHLARLPQVDQVWLVACRPVPFRIGEDDEEVRMLMVMDRASRFILEGFPVQGEGGIKAAAVRILELFGGQNLARQKGLPKALLIEEAPLHALVAPILRLYGVACEKSSSHAEIDAVLEQMVGGIGIPSKARATRTVEPQAASSLGMPSPSDWNQWRAIADRLIQRMLPMVQLAVRTKPELWARYFGEQGSRLVRENEENAPLMVQFLDWLWLRYRRQMKEKTIGEQMLAGRMPADEAWLLRSMLETPISLYRMESKVRENVVRFEDLIRSGHVDVHDRSLYDQAPIGIAFATRIYKAGDLNFLSNPGVPLSAFEVPLALEYLRGLGLESTSEGLLRGEHLFGRLLEWQEARPKARSLANTDGDPLVWHRAEYAARDAEAVCRSLDAMPHVEVDDAQLYRWLGPASSQTPMGPVLSLIHI